MKVFFTYLFTLTFGCLFAQNTTKLVKLQIERIPPEFELLSRNYSIYQMLQSKDGYLWFATSSGLIRFDGYETKTYRNNAGEPSSIPYNKITRIAEDSKGNLWLGLFHKGISCFNPETEQFTNYSVINIEHSNRDAISCLFIDQNDEVWFSVGLNGISHLNKQTGKFKTYKIITESNCPHLSSELLRESNYANDMIEMDKDNLYIATTEGLFLFNKLTGQSISLRDKMPEKSTSVDYNAIVLLKVGEILWIGGWSSGLRSYDPKTKTYKQYMFASKTNALYTTNIIQDICIKEPNELWVASSDKGLGVFNITTGMFSFYSDQASFNMMPRALQYIVFKEKSGYLWACFNNEIFKLNSFKSGFIEHPINSYQNQNSNISRSLCVYEDSTRTYSLIGTGYEDGLIYTDWTKNITKRISFPVSLADDKTMHVLEILQRDSKSVWMLTRDNLCIVDLEKALLQEVIDLPLLNKVSKSNEYFSFALDRFNNKLILTTNSGVITYSVEEKKAEVSGPLSEGMPARNFSQIKFDSKNRMWAGGYKNSFLAYSIDISNACIYLDGNGNEVPINNSIRVNKIVTDLNNNILACTEEGLLVFDCAGKKPVLKYRLDASKGIGNDNVFSASADLSGNIWLISGFGLYRFNTKNQSLTKVEFHQDRNDIIESVVCTKANNIYLTGLKKYYVLDKQSLESEFVLDEPSVTSLKINGVSYNFRAELESKNRITIPSDYQYFSISFACLNSKKVESLQYNYKLEGQDNNWISSGNIRSLTFSNIPGGSYLLKIRASDTEEVNFSSSIEIPLFIETVFYKKAWFRVSIISIIIVTLLWLYQFRTNQIEAINKLNNRAQLLEKEKAVVHFENLKQQLNPHFLFNSLTSLGSLITIDPKVAKRFVNQMSQIYRYILKSSQHELVNLSSEIDFAKVYIDLQLTRFSEGLLFDINIPENYFHYKIVPVTMQNLIENAIKHNIIESETPLRIYIFIDSEYLVVKNNLQQKTIVESSNKQGLSQLSSLYKYLIDKPILIEENSSEYIIKIPLIL